MQNQQPLFHNIKLHSNVQIVVYTLCAEIRIFSCYFIIKNSPFINLFDQIAQQQMQDMNNCNDQSIDSSISQRNNKIRSMRLSLKQIPILTQTTTRIRAKISLQQKPTRFSGSNSDIDLDSLSDKEIEGQDMFNFNSFTQKYDLKQKLGQGANGCVYRCQHKYNQNIYAVKKFVFQQQHILGLKRSFIIMKELSHPSICNYKALYLDMKPRVGYLIMDHLPYPSLEKIKIEDEKELCTITRQLVAALTYLNNRNICHRDIKPQNILYDRTEKKIKLIDFGISKKTFLRGQRRDMLTMTGTHFYIAPQVFNGGGYDQRIDLWALGVTIYKLITGRTPFQSEYHSTTVTNILKGEVKFQEAIWRKYDFFAKDFVNRLLKVKQTRMTLSEAQNHLWLKTQNRKRGLHKLNTHNIPLNEAFHYQMKNNMMHAKSKEQGCKNQKKILGGRSVKLISEMEYDLSDDQEEPIRITRSAITTRKFDFQIKPVYEAEDIIESGNDVI